MPQRDPSHLPRILIVAGVFLLYFGAHEILERARIEVAGTVTSAETSCVVPPGGRCSTSYEIRPDRDGLPSHYDAGPTDASLPRYLPVGTHLQKDRWAMTYVLDGRTVDDFHRLFYGTAALLGLALAARGSWALLMLRARSSRTAST